MIPICFIDGARFTDADGFLRDLRHAVLAVPDIEEACELLIYLGRGAAAGGSRGRTRLCLIWLNSDVSRRRFPDAAKGEPETLWAHEGAGAATRTHGIGFGTLTRWLGGFRDVELILL
ncbi:MAG TPA: hypothetical protein VF046_00940 [Gemmatimonadales bacterium]